MIANGPWKFEHDERLVALRAERCSASGIAEILTREFGIYRTRNAVLGRSHRLKITTSRAEENKRRARVAKAKRDAKPKVARPQPSLPGPITSQIKPGDSEIYTVTRKPTLSPRTAPVPYIPPAKIQCDALGGVTILELRDRHCRWPMGDPSKPEFRFCGKRKAGKTYCAGHAAIAYIPPEQRKRRAA
jgi:GcrA cell cycle regulator